MSESRETPKSAKITINQDELNHSETERVVSQIKSAQEVPLVRNVGEETKNFGGYLNLLWMTLAGLAGGLLTWVLWQVIPTPEDTTAANIQTSVTIAIAIGLVLIAVDSGLTRNSQKIGKAFAIGVPAAIVLGLFLGVIANFIYSSMTEATWDRLIEDGFDPLTESFYEEFASQNHLNRGLAWSVAGLASGLTVGISTLAWKRILVTGVGGLVGGFLGGFLFDFFTGEEAAQIVGLLVLGSAIGVSIGLMEQATKSSWLEITQGGMAGKQFILYKNQITIGSAPSADVTLIKDPSIPHIAATLSRRGAQMHLQSQDHIRPVIVNGFAHVTGVIQDGATISIGGTTVRYRERSKQKVKDGIRSV